MNSLQRVTVLAGLLAGCTSLASISHAETGTTESRTTNAVSGTMHEPETRENDYPRDLEVDVDAEAERQGPHGGDVTTHEVVRDNDKSAVSEKVDEPDQQLEENAVTAVESGDDKEVSEIKQESENTWKGTKSAVQKGWVEGKLETALMLEKQLESSDIEINVKNGQAILEGQVPSEAEKELAEKIAADVEGVDSVKNNLTVTEEKSKDRTASIE